MAATTFYIPPVNMSGAGCLADAVKAVKGYGFKHALIVSDGFLVKSGIVSHIVELLLSESINSTVYDGVMPNPTVASVEAGLAVAMKAACDFVISVGGGSPHDCAKGIALLATNGGKIEDYEGVDRSGKAQLPLVAVNTTAGTASEMTRFCIITDEVRHVKMAIVDRNVTPILSVNDPALMVGMPPQLTAATGMDALTHAIEAYVSVAATPITDACALQAVKLISTHLRAAYKDGHNIAAREGMAYAQFLAGMAFNNASLGYVHAMAHQLGGFYNLAHGVCNAVLLPHVQAYNATQCAARLSNVAQVMGKKTDGLTDEAGAEACLVAIRQLARDLDIPSGLAELGVQREDIPTLAANALKDACAATNPRQGTQGEIEALFAAAL
ncbi:alcohol dehydrogenase [Neokomagataea thailandica NBRC 106555]|uniref:Alcohol dehydrogenase 2 n=2 Tax=Neokomagataea TaxID=1223423 RepID=A0A4Y6V948_9PROT|nr:MULTISPECIES: L-threonine dehydrogenase [Neokomagataea]QDH25141.1 L-threonine dehydrogenase [Neokomagataea tanensis]GBR52037.1 alcohol dehydrogenase [Neokomagataea thailandica NBRC 106555]